MGVAYKRVSSILNKILRLTFEMINHQFIKRYLTTKALSGSLDIFTPNFCIFLQGFIQKKILEITIIFSTKSGCCL